MMTKAIGRSMQVWGTIWAIVSYGQTIESFFITVVAGIIIGTGIGLEFSKWD